MFAVGLTGGVASGKSLAAHILESLGAIRFSADEASRAVTGANSPLVSEIARTFGPQVLLPSGALNRAYLAKRIFADAQARQRLERLLHPAILRLLWAQMEACRYDFAADTIVVVEVPLLFEVHLEGWFHRTVAVFAPEAVLLERIQARDMLSKKEAKLRLAAQWPMEKKVARADYVLRNEGDISQFHHAVLRLWNILRQEAQGQERPFQIHRPQFIE